MLAESYHFNQWACYIWLVFHVRRTWIKHFQMCLAIELSNSVHAAVVGLICTTSEPQDISLVTEVLPYMYSMLHI